MIEILFGKAEPSFLISALPYVGSLLVILIPTLAGLWIYGRQKIVDQNHELMLRRREAYESFLDAMAELFIFHIGDSGVDENQVKNQFFRSRTHLTIVGSDSVVRAAQPVSKRLISINKRAAVGTFSDRATELNGLLCVLIKEMREDCFESTDLSDDTLQSLLPTYATRITK